MADNATKRNKPISVDEREEETPTIRKIRVICSNPGATNCSTDEEGKSKDQSSESNPTVREILFDKVDHCDHSPIHSKNGHKNPGRISVRSPRKLYKGVYQRKSGRWVSEIRNPITKARVWLGTFNTAEEAFNAYLSKELEFKQETQPIVSKDTAIVTSISPIGNGETIRGNTMEAVKEEVNNEGLVVGQKLPIQGVEKPRKPHGRVQVRKSGMWASRQGDQNPRKPYKGAYLRKSGRWRAIIKNPIEKVRVSLGTFNTAEEASNAYLSKKLEFEAQLMAKQDKKLIIGSEREPINDNSMKPVESGGLVVGQHLPIQGGQRVNLGLELGSKIIDNYGNLLGEFSSLDDLSICDIE